MTLVTRLRGVALKTLTFESTTCAVGLEIRDCYACGVIHILICRRRSLLECGMTLSRAFLSTIPNRSGSFR